MGYNGCLVEEVSPDTFSLFNSTHSSYKKKMPNSHSPSGCICNLCQATIILKYTAFLLPKKFLYILRLYQMYIVIFIKGIAFLWAHGFFWPIRSHHEKQSNTEQFTNSLLKTEDIFSFV